jgi:uncharacterized membrane protein HdeD (DUF308 family)
LDPNLSEMLSYRQRMSKIVAGPSVQLGRPWTEGPASRIWWLVLLRAAAAIVFGGLTLGWPRHTASVLIGLFGAYALLDGLIALLLSARGEGLLSRWSLTLAGLSSVAAGLFALAQPRLMALMLVAVMGVWLVLRGVNEIAQAAKMGGEAGPQARPRRQRRGVLLNGAMSALFGLALVAAPHAGALGLVWAIGAWAVAHGLLMIPFALSLRRNSP